MHRQYTPRVECVCQNCGSVFTIPPSGVSLGRGKFCSRRCADEGRRRNYEERFWSLAEKTSTCWLWTGSKSLGYGKFNDSNGTKSRAHRVSWEIHHGPIPKGMQVLHNCPGGDNRACVNPAHLFLGTHKENMRDMVLKGRTRTGSRHRLAKLTENQVLEIRARYAVGERKSALARAFGVCEKNISDIVNHKTWLTLSHASPNC